ncbi:phage baseplate assembly protein V [Mycobacterium sp. 050134]|uniref:phage baseplate assembly protein V n=1 Tax=Mycobacterium sp. 050134 TaxID=3096111 RepID=UPI002ED990A8
MNEDLLFELADRLQNRFFGKYRGIVTDVDAPTLRIKAAVPAVLGTTPTGWCLPCVPYAGPAVGFFFVPSPGAAVWIEFEGGDVSLPIWTGCYWRAGELPAEAAPTTRGIVTGAPHQLLFDDDADAVTLSDSNGGAVAFDGSGVTTTRGQMSVAVADGAVSINDDAFTVT